MWKFSNLKKILPYMFTKRGVSRPLYPPPPIQKQQRPPAPKRNPNFRKAPKKLPGQLQGGKGPCNCKLDAAWLEVKKDGPNKGRRCKL